MITLLNTLYSYHENISKTIEDIINVDDKQGLTIEDQLSKGNVLRDRIEDISLFILVEAIILTSNQSVYGIIDELESNYTNWAKQLARFYIRDYEIDIYSFEYKDDYSWIIDILGKNINALNKIGARYFNVSKDKHHTFSEYLTLAKAQFLFLEQEEAYFKAKHQNIISDEDKVLMLTSQFDIPLKDIIKSKKPRTVDLDVFSESEIVFIKSNDKIVREKNFKVSTTGGNVNITTSDKLSDEEVSKFYAFLQSNKSLGYNVNIRSFKMFVRFKNSDTRMFWEGSKVDALRLVYFLGCEIKDFNDWFYLKDRAKLKPSDRAKPENGSNLSTYLLTNLENR